MKIKSSYMPWLCAIRPNEDISRPILYHLMVERINETHGLMVGADGFLMGVFPVELEPDEETGLVAGEVVRYARDCRTSQGFYTLVLNGETVELPNGSTHKRLVCDGAFPNWREIANGARKLGGQEPAIGVTLRLLDKLARSLGIEPGEGVWMEFSEQRNGCLGPMLVRRITQDHQPLPRDEELTEAYGILMPAKPGNWVDGASQ